MAEQVTIADYAAQKRDEAIARAEEASWAWVQAARTALAKTCKRYKRFTADQVWEVLDELREEIGFTWEPNDNRAMGAVLMNGKKNGICQPTNEFVNSKKASCHRGPKRVWESRGYQGE